ncbi:MAG: nucleoside 2-deoxyribosyltransferase domain-containing protein [Candidatus Pacebacteria bacterium]|nr:nucleoside 2-deoxyribosyltransferase domain-containing protein [Candidatus Paceibacterota bacterium]
MTIYKAPQDISKRNSKQKSIFLAGSIEQGKADNWQKYCEEKLSNTYTLFNPRRESWNPELKQDIEEKEFNTQVNWELDALEQADIIIMYLQPGTLSPISLLELGLMIKEKEILIICPEGFWRKGNVDIVAQRFNQKTFKSLETAISYLMKK